MPDGRVLIAFDDGPLEPSPTWTRIDDTDQLVAGFDTESGRATLSADTDTGTASVYINDTDGLFDPANTASPYFGNLDGKQILLQCWNPVTLTWVEQWRGWIDGYGFDINPATGPDGKLVLANVQIDCVDIFDFLAGYGLTPGLDGVTPPVGGEGSVWYAETVGTVDDRIIEILGDVGIDSTRYVVFSGNVRVQEVNYDPDESALVALRDACEAELPQIANMYVDRKGRFVFHGRLSRFTPDEVADDAGDEAWDFQRWKLGDGLAIAHDSDRGQMRVLRYAQARENVVNAAMCWPKGTREEDMPGQVYADTTSIDDFGKRALPPIGDLLVEEGTTTGNDKLVECAKYAELIVKNQKDPRVTIELLTVKPVVPTDHRATATWSVLTRADISDIINLKVGYPGSDFGIGGGLEGPGEDYYIESVIKRVRPLNPTHDYIEADFGVSPAVWSQDTHGVFD